MFTVPAFTPVTIPAVECTTAVATEPEVHVPPGVPFESVIEDSVHTAAEPVIAVGGAFTCITVEVLQPVGSMYEIIAVPMDAMPVAIPELEPTEMMPGMVLDHVPPGIELLSATDRPWQITGPPTMAPGAGNIVTVFVMMQPVVVNLYVIMELPPLIPVTRPEVDPIAAIEGLPLIPVPPVDVVLSEVVNPSQAYKVPVIGLGVGFTVTVR